ncbi:MAG: bifunctional diaminohydroxyphosphoribosylaminopyrimidine deaminase/5-amino-6-(5-phosphoribosylamino)uracil reductase RibD [Chthoniobacterales bacterium]
MQARDADETFMRAALAEAAKGFGLTSPNPAVGAVLVAQNKIIARGHHRRAGDAHAEIHCLRTFGGRAPEGSTLYVTLEPCSTTGRTPPCTESLIEAGIETVVVGAIDMNPKHTGRGLEVLRRAGVTVRAGVLANECAAINQAFNKWIQSGVPFVIAKCGMTLDGRLTRPRNEERWITSAAARRHANRFRAQVDAILIGAETLRADDPNLTVRAIAGARQPWRVILSRSGKLPSKARVFTDRFADRTLVFRQKPLQSVLRELGKKEITSVLIEGGGDILGQALAARLIDKVHLYAAPIFSGGPVIAFSGRGISATSDAIRLRDVRYERIGDDIFIAGNTAGANYSPE